MKRVKTILKQKNLKNTYFKSQSGTQMLLFDNINEKKPTAEHDDGF